MSLRYISEHPELQLNPYLPCPAVDYEWGSRKPGTGWTSIRLLHPVEADKGDMPMQPCDMPYGNWAELCGVIAFVAAARDALLPVNPKGVIGHQPAVVSVAVDCRIEGPSRCF